MMEASKIIGVAHVRWVININHKTMATVSTHFCQSTADVTLFESYVQYLV